jgi:hypothetical protein
LDCSIESVDLIELRGNISTSLRISLKQKAEMTEEEYNRLLRDNFERMRKKQEAVPDLVHSKGQ